MVVSYCVGLNCWSIFPGPPSSILVKYCCTLVWFGSYDLSYLGCIFWAILALNFFHGTIRCCPDRPAFVDNLTLLSYCFAYHSFCLFFSVLTNKSWQVPFLVPFGVLWNSCNELLVWHLILYSWEIFPSIYFFENMFYDLVECSSLSSECSTLNETPM